MSPEKGRPVGKTPKQSPDPSLLALCLLLALAPAKFGNIVGLAGLPLYPLSPGEWIFGLWPPFMAAVMAGAVLLLTTLTSRKTIPSLTVAGWLPVLPVAILVVGALPGYAVTTEWAAAFPIFWHFLSALAIAMAVHIQLRASAKSRAWIIGAILLGTVFTLWSGIEQIVVGFKATREYVDSLVAAGQQVPEALLQRVAQSRAFGSFTYPNNLAAHLLVVMPVVAAAGWRLGHEFEPVKVSRLVLPGIMLGFCSWVFMATGSRGAVMALVAAAGGMFVMSLFAGDRRKITRMAILTVLAVALTGASIAIGGRDRLSSVGARATYYKAAVEMSVSHPIAGVGWGEFYTWYMRLKPVGAEETRMPHNLFLAFSSQAGLVGAAAALAFLLHPLLMGVIGRHYGWQPADFWHGPIASALLAWLAHALLDFNLMVPGTVLTVAALSPMLLQAAPDVPSIRASTGRTWVLPSVVGLLAIAGIWQRPGELAYQRLEAAVATDNVAAIRNYHQLASRLMPHSPHPDDLFARTAMQHNSWDEAAAAWERAIDRAPHRSGFYLRLAEASLAGGHPEKAKEALEMAERWYPTSPHLQFLRDRLAPHPSTAPPNQ